MASIKSGFTSRYLTHRDIKEINPGWTDGLVDDYLALKRDVESVADESDVIKNNSTFFGSAQALLDDLLDKVGTGDFLTCDETGFTCDSTNLTVDMDEA